MGIEAEHIPDEHEVTAREQDSTAPLVKWLFAGAGLLVVGFAIAWLLYRAFSEELPLPPNITIAIDSVVEQERGRWLVAFTVENRGGTAAADLLVEGTLGDPRDPEQTSTATIAYVPAESERFGGLFFTSDPRRLPLRIRPHGYEVP